MREQLDEARQEVSKLSDNLKRNEAELLEYRKDRHGVVDERDSLMKMVERRNFEVERLEDDIKSLKQQLNSAINAKCEALSKYDEIQHKESTIEFKVSRHDNHMYLYTKIFLNQFSYSGKKTRTRASFTSKSNRYAHS